MTTSPTHSGPICERLREPLVIEYAVPIPVHEVLQRARADRGKAADIIDDLLGAREFSATPAVYEPHPHGPAFDQRDLSFVARNAIAKAKGDS